MAINVYGKKEFENDEYVIYNFGCNHDELTGKLRFNKGSLELIILKSEEGSLSDSVLFKIASRIKNRYQETGEFPDNAVSAS